MKKNNKRGLSVVVATMLMVILVMSAVVLVFTVVRNMIDKEINEAEDCFGVEFGEKVTLNEDYTCYNSTNQSVHISINIDDVKIDGLLVAVESAGASKSFELTNEEQNLPEVKNYPSYSSGVKLPGENSGLTYYFANFPTEPASIRIRPKVGENNCQQTDEITQIEDCNIIVGL